MTGPPPAKPPVVGPPAAKPPVVGAPPAAKPPVVGAPPVAKPPVVGAPPMAKPPVVGAPPAAKPPVVGAPPAAKPPVVGAPPSAKPPTVGAPPVAMPPGVKPSGKGAAEGAQPKVGDAKPTLTFKKFSAVYLSAWHGDNDTCSICRLSLTGPCVDCEIQGQPACAFSDGTCGHTFHGHCIQKWLRQESAAGSCPLCNSRWELK
jgi:RING-box protein 1